MAKSLISEGTATFDGRGAVQTDEVQIMYAFFTVIGEKYIRYGHDV